MSVLNISVWKISTSYRFWRTDRVLVSRIIWVISTKKTHSCVPCAKVCTGCLRRPCNLCTATQFADDSSDYRYTPRLLLDTIWKDRSTTLVHEPREHRRIRRTVREIDSTCDKTEHSGPQWLIPSNRSIKIAATRHHCIGGELHSVHWHSSTISAYTRFVDYLLLLLVSGKIIFFQYLWSDLDYSTSRPTSFHVKRISFNLWLRLDLVIRTTCTGTSLLVLCTQYC